MTDYDFKKIEKKWSDKWLKDKVYEPFDFAQDKPDLDKAKNPFYNLMMFPYPSAEGLHVGNVYAFVGADIYGRKKRMEGFDVFEPIGLDGFGIHSENYALKTGKHPKEQAEVSEKNFYKQMRMIGNGFSWDEKLETYDPDYYKWTQWIFVQMFKKGLAYRKKAMVNWCPKCLTVLADEQVLAGECERCGTKVIKKELEQWFFKITDYAERLLADLDKIDWSERVKIAQRNWIGKSEGASIRFPLVGVSGQPDEKHYVEVFTTRPDTLYGATFIVVSPELAKFWIDIGWQAPDKVKKYIADALAKRGQKDTEKEKTGIDSGIFSVNPANKEKIPVWVADYVLAGYGTGAIMAVPAHDQRDLEFWKAHRGSSIKGFNVVVYPDENIPDIIEIKDAYVGDGIMHNSGPFNGLLNVEAGKKITDFVGGKMEVKYHLRDWLISRQRYWGPPIPMIFCQKCDWQPASEKDLPVLLPDVKDFRPTGTDKSPLATVEGFVKTKCPKCGGDAERETDVSDTFLDSAWYFFRYPDVKNKKEPFSKKTIKKWLPIDMYTGGAEHHVLHLLYTRFLTKVFRDWGLVDFDEPFKKFRAHGLLIKDGAKMSKSKGNVVNPDEYIKKFGADVLRMYLMFLGPFEQGGDFRDESIAGIDRFLNRVWNLKDKIGDGKSIGTEILLHKSIKKIGEDIEKLHYNTAISQLMILLSGIEKGCDEKSFKIFLKLLAPFAPFVAEELWDDKTSIHKSKWPEYDEKKIKEETKTIIVQINGKIRDKFEVANDISEDNIKTQALARDKIKEILVGKKPKKIIIARGRLVNIVL